MTNTARQNLFTDPFDDFLRGFLFRPMPFESPSASQFRLDVLENEIAYRVRADLPGAKKEDIVVSVEGNTVTISAEIRPEIERAENDRVLRAERFVGKLTRSFSLAADVEEGGAEARYVDGVLDLVLPKRTVAAGKRVAIR